MMVVGANAADFTDAESIKHGTAVETMAALGIIKGYPQPDGTLEFAPEGELNRAQMAQMIATIMNKGTAPNWAVKETPTFQDVAKGSWYEAAVEYCANLGYINGYGNGYFGPNDELTATQAARMILNAMGYKWDGQGDWQLATEVQARDEALDLYYGLDDVVTNAVMTRDSAAQMLFNAINAPLAGNETYSTDGDPVGNGVFSITVLEGTTNAQLSALAAKTYTSFIEAYTLASNIEIEDGKNAKIGVNFSISEGQTASKVNEPETLAHKYLSVSSSASSAVMTAVMTETSGSYKGQYKYTIGGQEYHTTEDYTDLMGQRVQVLYKGTNRNSVYGILDNGGNVAYEGTVGGYKAYNADLNSAYRVNTATFQATGWNAGDTLTAIDELDVTYSVKAVDNNRDGIVDMVLVLPYTTGTVTYKNATQVTVTGLGTVKISDIDLYEDAKVGDSVMITAKANNPASKAKVEKLETVTGTITGVRNTSTVQVNGEWYTNGTGAAGLSNSDISNNYTLTVVHGYYISTAKNTAVSSNMAIVLAKGETTSGFKATNLARLLLTDGTVAEVTVNESAESLIGKLVTYNAGSNNVYTLEEVENAAAVGYNVLVKEGKYNGSKRFAPKTGSTVNIADDAVVLLAYNTGKGSDGTKNTTLTGKVSDTDKVAVITGEELKSWTVPFGAEAASYALVTKVNGIDYVKVLFLAADAATLPGATSDVQYGFVVSDVEYTSINGVTYATYEVFDGTDTIPVYEEGRTTAAAEAIIISFNMGNDNIVTNVEDAGFKPAAIMGYSETDQEIVLRNADGTTAEAVKFTNKLQKFYIDSYNWTGAQGSGVMLAAQNADGSYTLNAYYLAEGDTVVALFMDVNNNLYEGSISPAPKLIAPEEEVSLKDTVTDDVFTINDYSKFTELKSAEWGRPATDLIFFRYDASYATAETQKYTLYIGTTIGGDEVLETWTDDSTDKGVHFFAVDVKGVDETGAGKTVNQKWNQKDASGNVVKELKKGNYTFTIKGADGLTYAQGTFYFAGND